MGSAEAEGENRAIEAIQSALSSPLLNDNDIEGASNVLLYITSGEDEISMDEVTEITDYIQREAKSQAEIIWGNGTDTSLGKKISITLIATGFDSKQKKKALDQENKTVYRLEDEISESSLFMQDEEKPVAENQSVEDLNKNKLERVLDENDEDKVDMEKITLLRKAEKRDKNEGVRDANDIKEQRTFVFEVERKDDDTVSDDKPASIHQQRDIEKEIEEETANKPFEVFVKKPAKKELESGTDTERQALEEKTRERIEKLKNLSYKLKTESGLEELEKEPAYKRKKVDLDNSKPSEESQVSKFSLYEDDEKNVSVRTNNSFLHDNVD
jgi:cell division protein FtsZ